MDAGTLRAWSLFALLSGALHGVSVPLAAQTATSTVLYSFTGASTGYGVYAGLVQAPDGNFYGAVTGEWFSDDASYTGAIFRLTPSGTVTTIHQFSPVTGSPQVNADGAYPASTLAVGPDGNLYGVTLYGGANGGGTVFKLTLGGSFTVLYNFCSQSACADGGAPLQQPLTLASDGNFYGTTEAVFQGASPGTIYKITPSGAFSLLYTFPDLGGNSTNDQFAGGLLQATDGNFYFYDYWANISQTPCYVEVGDSDVEEPCGAIGRITPSGAEESVASFGPGGNLAAAGFGFGAAVLAEAKDGLLYGTTPAGGYEDDEQGSSFSLSLGGTFTGGSGDNGGGAGTSDGFFPASDGNLYTMAETGFTYYSTGFASGGGLGVNVISPVAPIQGSDGNFYGAGNATEAGNPNCGNEPCGELYKITLSPALPAPVQLSLENSSISLGDSADVSFSVLNAFSTTMQQCYGFSTLNGVTTPLGKVTGTLSNGIYSGSASFTPTADGTYSLALTCGGVESGFATLTVTGSSEPITFTSVTHNFGSLQVGNSGSYGVKVTNPNASAFPFHLILSGPSTFTEATNCGSSIPGNGSCQIEFYFAPTSATTQTATWSLTANSATFSPSNGGTLTGTGVLNGSLNYTTSVHNFGTYTVGTDSPVYGTVLTNSYNFPVTLGYTTSGSTTSFSLLTNCGATLAAGQSCNADFTFTPKATGFVTETVGVTASYKGSPIAVTSLGATITGITLKGTGD